MLKALLGVVTGNPLRVAMGVFGAGAAMLLTYIWFDYQSAKANVISLTAINENQQSVIKDLQKIQDLDKKMSEVINQSLQKYLDQRNASDQASRDLIAQIKRTDENEKKRRAEAAKNGTPEVTCPVYPTSTDILKRMWTEQNTCKDFMKLETPEEIIAKGDGAVSLVWENTLSVAHDCKSQLDNLVDYIDTQNKKIEESNRE